MVYVVTAKLLGESGGYSTFMERNKAVRIMAAIKMIIFM